MYYVNYIANSKISNHINTKHQILKDKSKSTKCIPDLRKMHNHGLILTTEDPDPFSAIL